MRLIAIDAAAGTASLCLQVAGDRRFWRGAPRDGPAPVLAALRALLAEAGMAPTALDAIAFGRGPGAFTGVRLAVALAQGLGLGAARPLVPVSDLAAVAWRAGKRFGHGRVFACTDARRGEVYCGGYAVSADKAEGLAEETLAVPSEAAALAGGWFVAGTGLARVPGLRATEGADAIEPDARAVAALAPGLLAAGGAVPAGKAEPVYLRDRVAQVSSGRHNRKVP